MSDIDIHQFSINNWSKIPEEKRRLCISHLRDALIPSSRSLVEIWKTEVRAGQTIGSSKPGGFHFNQGMGIRNILRQVMLDADLPDVRYRDEQEPQHNWDDFYYGALDEFVRQEITATPTMYPPVVRQSAFGRIGVRQSAFGRTGVLHPDEPSQCSGEANNCEQEEGA